MSNETLPLSITAEGERGIPSTQQKKSPRNMRNMMIWSVIIMAVFTAVISFMYFLTGIEKRKQEAIEQKQNQPAHVTENVTPKNFKKDKQDIKAEEQLESPKEHPSPPENSTATTAANPNGMVPPIFPASQLQSSSSAMTSSATKNMESPHDRKMSGSVMVETESNRPASDNSGSFQPPSLLGSAEGAGQRVAKDSLDERFSASQLAGTRARLRGNMNFLLRRGTVIPCVLKTRIISTYPGMASCQVAKDVYSANGKVLLIERGSEIIGEQRTALNQGQARIFVLWSRLETPKGVSVDLNSPGTDALGATGHEAEVDTHFWARFGGAIMLSLIDDFAAAATSNTSGNSNTVYFANTANASQAVAAKALESTINIPPTGYTHQGALLNVFVARDVDFKSVYELVHVETQ